MSDTPDPSALPGTDTGTETPNETPGAGIGGPALSLGEAHRTTGAARSTIQRRLLRGEIPGATRTPEGGWSIPVASLIAAGLAPRVTPADPPSSPTTTSPEDDELRAELVAARALAERYRVEAELAHELAEERGRHVDDLRLALEAMARALGPGPVVAAPVSATPAATPTTDPSPESVTPRRRGWRS